MWYLDTPVDSGGHERCFCMNLLALIAVFFIEQYQPLAYRRVVGEPLQHWADFIAQRFNAGQRSHGIAAWLVAVLLPVLALGLVYFVLAKVNVLLGFLLTVCVLYLGMGFRQFSHHFSEIQLALRLGDIERRGRRWPTGRAAHESC